MAPNLGQGANSALVDAAVLRDELRRCSTLAEGLAAYERRRQKAVRRVADASSRLGRLAEVTHPVARTLRDRVLLPIVGLFATTKATSLLLQEPTETLLALGTWSGTMIRLDSASIAVGPRADSRALSRVRRLARRESRVPGIRGRAARPARPVRPTGGNAAPGAQRRRSARLRWREGDSMQRPRR